MPSDLQNASDMPEELPTPSEEGYRICIDVTSEGYEVTGPNPLPAEPQGDDNQEEHNPVPDLTTAVKHVLAIVKENPIGADANEQMKAGYESA